MNKNYLSLHCFFGLVLLFPSFVFSQTAATDAKWITLESPKKDLSFDAPENFLVNVENGKYEIFASQNNAVMNVTVNNDENVYKLYGNIPREPDDKVSQFKLADFTGEVHKTEKGKKISIVIYTASSEAFYSIVISSKDSSNPTLVKFVDSLKLRGNPLFKQENVPDTKNLPKVSIETLKTSQIILDVLKAKDVKRDKGSRKDEIKYEAENAKEIEDENSYSRPMIVLRKPQPSYTDSARQSNTSGTVKLKVQFRADGSVGDITVLSKLDRGLEREAIRAARKIKFLPAEIDGKPVDIFKKISYHFTIY